MLNVNIASLFTNGYPLGKTWKNLVLSPSGDRCCQPASAASDSPDPDGTAAAGGGATPKGGGRKATETPSEGQVGRRWCLLS